MYDSNEIEEVEYHLIEVDEQMVRTEKLVLRLHDGRRVVVGVLTEDFDPATKGGLLAEINARTTADKMLTPLKQHGSTVGLSWFDETLGLVIDVETNWGISPIDGVYFEEDPNNVPADEAAILDIDSDNVLSWLLLSEVQ